MKVLIKCRCTDGEIEFVVRDRQPDEDIMDYMSMIQLALGHWHTPRGCDQTALDYLKMPVVEGKSIGES